MRKSTLFLILTLVPVVYPQTAFDAVSVKRVDGESHLSVSPNGTRTFRWKPVEFKGIRLTGDAPLRSYIEFACSPLMKEFRIEELPALREYYQIEAVAPDGTTMDQAREMVRKVLAERLGFQFHIANKDIAVYNLVRGSGALKLTPATGPPPNMESHRNSWELHVKSYTLQNFANFVSGTAGKPVIDKTGITGLYSFDVDWYAEVQESMATGFRGQIDPVIAIDGVKAFGLKLESGTEMRSFLVVDHVNREPSPN